MAVILCNTDTVAHVWWGQIVQANSQYTAQLVDRAGLAQDKLVIADLATGILIINNGTSDITDAAEAYAHLCTEANYVT